MNDHIENHGIETKRFFDEEPRARQYSTAPDGNIYALPTWAGCYHCMRPQKLWIYQPWLDTLGLAMPTTTEEFEQVLLAFKEQDPNGNGQTDELPLIGATGGAQPFDYFFMNAFLFDPGGDRLIVREGNIEPIYTTSQWQQGIMYLSRLHAQGLLDPESLTQDRDQLRQITNTPDTPIMGSVPALAPSAFIDINLDGGRWTDYVAVPPLEGPEGVRFAAYSPFVPFRPGEFVITTQCQNPELAFQWADGLYDLKMTLRAVIGVPGQHRRWAEEGEIGNNGEPAVWKKLVPIGQVQNYTWSQSSPYYRPESVHSGHVRDPETADRDLEAILYRETEEKYVPYQQPEDMVIPPLFFTEEQAQTVAELGATITPYVEETFALAVTGQIDIEAEFEAEWGAYLANLEGIGLSQYLQAYQEAFDAGQE